MKLSQLVVTELVLGGCKGKCRRGLNPKLVKKGDPLVVSEMELFVENPDQSSGW